MYQNRSEHHLTVFCIDPIVSFKLQTLFQSTAVARDFIMKNEVMFHFEFLFKTHLTQAVLHSRPTSVTSSYRENRKLYLFWFVGTRISHHTKSFDQRQRFLLPSVQPQELFKELFLANGNLQVCYYICTVNAAASGCAISTMPVARDDRT